MPLMPHRFLSILVLLATTALAATLSTERADLLRAELRAHQRETVTWSATVVQTLTMPGLRDPVKSIGRLAYRAPDRLRLDFTRPAGEFVLCLGDRLFIQKAGAGLTEKSLREDSAGRPYLALLDLLSGEPVEDEGAYMPEVTEDGGRYAVVLTRRPEASSRLPARIVNTIDADPLELREIVIDLPNGGVLGYRFDDITRNTPLDAARFALPDGPAGGDRR
jgi:outer membrane lipoprotein-sorting protein